MNVTVSLGAAKMAKDVAAAGVHLLRVESGVSVGLKSLHIGLVESALTHSAVPGPIILPIPAHTSYLASFMEISRNSATSSAYAGIRIASTNDANVRCLEYTFAVWLSTPARCSTAMLTVEI